MAKSQKVAKKRKAGRPQLYTYPVKTVGITVDQQAWTTVLELCKLKGVGISQLIRDFIADYLKRNGVPAK